MSWLLASVSWFSFLTLSVEPLQVSLEPAVLPQFAKCISNFYRALFAMQLNTGQLSELFVINADCGGHVPQRYS